ncbi:hypothetical protein WA158_002430 [Blastocystis sp. Blastoise]
MEIEEEKEEKEETICGLTKSQVSDIQRYIEIEISHEQDTMKKKKNNKNTIISQNHIHDLYELETIGEDTIIPFYLYRILKNETKDPVNALNQPCSFIPPDLISSFSSSMSISLYAIYLSLNEHYFDLQLPLFPHFLKDGDLSISPCILYHFTHNSIEEYEIILNPYICTFPRQLLIIFIHILTHLSLSIQHKPFSHGDDFMSLYNSIYSRICQENPSGHEYFDQLSLSEGVYICPNPSCGKELTIRPHVNTTSFTCSCGCECIL